MKHIFEKIPFSQVEADMRAVSDEETKKKIYAIDVELDKELRGPDYLESKMRIIQLKDERCKLKNGKKQ